MLLYQENPVRMEFTSHGKALFVSINLYSKAVADHMSENKFIVEELKIN